MRAKSPAVLIAVTLSLVAGVAAVLIGEGSAANGRLRRAEEFQVLVRGLGLGPAVDLSRCAFRFDPRLCPACPEDDGPVAGGSWFCPCQGCSIFYYPPLPSAEMDVHGLSP
jgi:hypothetical protein